MTLHRVNLGNLITLQTTTIEGIGFGILQLTMNELP